MKIAIIRSECSFTKGGERNATQQTFVGSSAKWVIKSGSSLKSSPTMSIRTSSTYQSK